MCQKTDNLTYTARQPRMQCPKGNGNGANQIDEVDSGLNFPQALLGLWDERGIVSSPIFVMAS